MNIEQFKQILDGEIFRVVTTKYHTVERVRGDYPVLTFVCKKGMGYDDWAIYYDFPDRSIMQIAEMGNKVVSKENILSIFPCDDEVYQLYRK